jgi:vitamin B12 transporter
MPALPIDTNQIVITASRAPENQAQTPASVLVIDQQRIERLDEPLVSALLRLTPSAAVATSGPAGSLTEVRIRGAEANHTLLFIDGIKINDPASGDAPRFELLNADLASRVEVVRGPQSALWGSDAIGGVIAINGVDDRPGTGAQVEGGSFGFGRAGGSAALVTEKASIAGAFGYQRSTGIDSFNGQGDKDGYHNLSGRLRATWHPLTDVEVGASALALTGYSEFDGYDPITFAHEDTLDNSRNRLTAGRVWTSVGTDDSPWRVEISGSALGSSNKNYLADILQNRTSGTRKTISGQIERRFALGSIDNRLILAGDTELEKFRARDAIYGGLTDQDRSRHHDSVTAEWRGQFNGLTADVAVRHDFFNRFKDATTIRASAQAPLGAGFSLAGSYSEGISQPTFFDLYGFFPSSFVGNPSLKPENSRGFEFSGRYRHGRLNAALTYYRQRLHDEIVDTYDPATFLSSTANRIGVSHRSGVEAELGWDIGDALRISANYAYLHATQPDEVASGQAKELRRPKHSGSVALDGSRGRLSYGTSVAFVGRRFDTRDNYPFDRVTLGSYWLADARIAYSVKQGIEVFARMSNALGQHYEDVFGYRTEPRAIYAGIRLADRRSSP